MTDYDDGSARWDAPHCPECGAEDVRDCCSDAADRERYAEEMAAHRRAAHDAARAWCGIGGTREDWLRSALRTRQPWVIELSDREIDAIAQVTWGALGRRRGARLEAA